MTAATQLPVLAGDPLDAKAERFATLYAGGTDAAKAYRECYDVAPTTLANTVRRKAHALRHLAPIAARIRALQSAAAEAVVIDVRDRMVHLWEVANADASEISRVVTECCRACYGIGGKPMWYDEAELQAAMEQHTASLRGPKPLPVPAFGGFGFNPALPPSDDCRACNGHGLQRVVLTPTDQLSSTARKLFKSARQKADGSIEVDLESRQAASEQLAKLAGWNIERSESKNLNVNVSAGDVAAIASRTPDEIVKLLFKRKDAPT
jgi:hypothetical protein